MNRPEWLMPYWIVLTSSADGTPAYIDSRFIATVIRQTDARGHKVSWVTVRGIQQSYMVRETEQEIIGAIGNATANLPAATL